MDHLNAKIFGELEVLVLNKKNNQLFRFTGQQTDLEALTELCDISTWYLDKPWAYYKNSVNYRVTIDQCNNIKLLSKTPDWLVENVRLEDENRLLNSKLKECENEKLMLQNNVENLTSKLTEIEKIIMPEKNIDYDDYYDGDFNDRT